MDSSTWDETYESGKNIHPYESGQRQKSTSTGEFHFNEIFSKCVSS